MNTKCRRIISAFNKERQHKHRQGIGQHEHELERDPNIHDLGSQLERIGCAEHNCGSQNAKRMPAAVPYTSAV